MRWWSRILPPTRLERDLVWQCVLSAFATGTFLTGTAVYFTQVVGLSGAEVGLGMSVAAGVTLLLQLPMGRLSDRVGAKPLWATASAVALGIGLDAVRLIPGLDPAHLGRPRHHHRRGALAVRGGLVADQ